MEGFYVVFDRARKRIGFAVSACHGERQGAGQSIHVLPVQQAADLGPASLGGRNSCLEPELAPKLPTAWRGDPACLGASAGRQG